MARSGSAGRASAEMTTSHNVSDRQLPRGAGDAAEVPPVPAASVILLRDSPLQVLMIRRHSKSSFVPDAWVFPGGVVEPADHDLGDGTELSTMRVAAARELFEESGIWLGAPLANADEKRRALLAGEITFASLIDESPLDLTNLVWTSRWITPIGVPKRFDTYFFLATARPDASASAENVEAVEVIWIAPSEAIEKLQIVFPTQKNLEAIAGFNSAEELLTARRGVEVPATRPVLVIEDGKKKIILDSV
jgi:8-oxo-dGTP pyrophosphatase MutT (NUDIX family)